MDFFIKEDNIRVGCRGGKNLFKWDDVRLLYNRERECYLGVSQSLGFLDKGGKWRKRDWWQNFKPDKEKNKKKLEEEIKKIKEEEKEKLREAIYGKNKDDNNNNINKLTDFQWERLMKKKSNENKNKLDFYDNDEHRPGLGINTTIKFNKSVKKIDNEDITKLKGTIQEYEKINNINNNNNNNNNNKELLNQKRKRIEEKFIQKKNIPEHHKHHHNK